MSFFMDFFAQFTCLFLKFRFAFSFSVFCPNSGVWNRKLTMAMASPAFIRHNCPVLAAGREQYLGSGSPVSVGAGGIAASLPQKGDRDTCKQKNCHVCLARSVGNGFRWFRLPKTFLVEILHIQSVGMKRHIHEGTWRHEETDELWKGQATLSLPHCIPGVSPAVGPGSQQTSCSRVWG